jgi:plasmid stabilization system protein ParE
MALKIYWSDFSKSQLQSIFDFYKKEAGARISRKLIQAIVVETERLSLQPFMGQKEELLTDRQEDFRFMIYKNYKIIYWINQGKNRIEIADIFDTRQNPHKIKRN